MPARTFATAAEESGAHEGKESCDFLLLCRCPFVFFANSCQCHRSSTITANPLMADLKRMSDKTVSVNGFC